MLVQLQKDMADPWPQRPEKGKVDAQLVYLCCCLYQNIINNDDDNNNSKIIIIVYGFVSDLLNKIILFLYNIFLACFNILSFLTYTQSQWRK
jgi:hypothetical protein